MRQMNENMHNVYVDGLHVSDRNKNKNRETDRETDMQTKGNKQRKREEERRALRIRFPVYVMRDEYV